jgi:hypothetical protein
VTGSVQGGVESTKSAMTWQQVRNARDLQECVRFGLVGRYQDFIAQVSDTPQHTRDQRLTAKIKPCFVPSHTARFPAGLNNDRQHQGRLV